MLRTQFYCLALTLFLFAQHTDAQELKVEPDKENVVASRIIGNWQINAELNERLDGGMGGELPNAATISFTADPTVVENIPEKFVEVLSKDSMQIYLAGMMDFDGITSPFILTVLRGNPHIIFWLDVDGDPFGNAESFNVMLAVAKENKNDLLFIGGDFNNQPFSAFERMQNQPKQ